jgi:FlaA1/EpsC-like NDP-sugar epimerase
MAAVFHELTPQLVFHAAAYKHVPVMEDFPEEAIRVNILGTRILAELSLQCGVEKFIFISTDKVVNPTSLMGASKRVAEMVITDLNNQEKTHFVAVRFGNVLGSRGSVIPRFQEQIKKGGPVTITHPDMKRYFMTIPEAVLLVLQAGSMGHGGEVFVLNMGEQAKIYDVACELIRLSGLEPHKDIPIVFTGIRPGEKLFEEVLTAEEGVEPTTHPKIFKARIKKPLSQKTLDGKIEKLKDFAQRQDRAAIIQTFQDLIPTYQPSRSDPDKKMEG